MALVNGAAKPLSVVHVTAPGPVGGLESVVRMLASGQRAADLEVRVVAVLDRGAAEPPFLDELADAGVEVIRIFLRSRAYLEERSRLKAVLEHLRPAVVHTHGYRADVQAGGVARRLGIPTVTTVHGFTGGDWKNRVYERLQVRAFRRFAAVVAVSAPLVEHLAERGVRRDRIHLVPNAAELDSVPLSRAEARRLLGLEAERFVVGWVGRLTREKGPDVFVRALAHPAARGGEAVVVGAGRERPALEVLARDLGVADRIRWCGVVPDAGRLFRAFDCFVLSSRTEGTPIVLFEAMAVEVPIVATSVGGVPDVVSGREAILVPAEDPAALAGAVAAVAADAAAARERAAAAKRRLEKERSIAPWLAAYEAVYRQVAGSGVVAVR